MKFPDTELAITSPEVLQRVLREIKQCLANGALMQTNFVGFGSINSIDDVPIEGPWPDYIEAYFEDAQHNKFKLLVETYHGAGGRWSRND